MSPNEEEIVSESGSQPQLGLIEAHCELKQAEVYNYLKLNQQKMNFASNMVKTIILAILFSSSMFGVVTAPNGLDITICVLSALVALAVWVTPVYNIKAAARDLSYTIYLWPEYFTLAQDSESVPYYKTRVLELPNAYCINFNRHFISILLKKEVSEQSAYEVERRLRKAVKYKVAT